MTMISCRQILTPLSFFWFMANLEQSRSRTLGVWSVKLRFSLVAFFYLTKTENRAKNLKCSSHIIALNKVLYLTKMLTSANLKGFCYWKAYFLKLNIRLYLRVKFQVSSIIVTSFRQGDNFTLHSTAKRTPKKPTKIRVNGSIDSVMNVSSNESYLNNFQVAKNVLI